MRTQLACLILSGAAVVGCDPFIRVDFEVDTALPPRSQIASSGIVLLEGRAVSVLATVEWDSGPDERTDLELESRNAAVLGLEPSLEDRSFVLWGVAPGTTTIAVTVEGEREADIPVTVVAQTEAP